MGRLSGRGWFSDLMNIHFRRVWFRAAAFTFMWWMLTAGSVNSWLVGAPVVLVATLISMVLVPPFSCSVVGSVRFVPFFIWHSLRGGADVAWRAFHPQMPIAPGLVDFPLRLPPGMCRVFMVNTVSLLPGTLSVELGANCLKVHVLDIRKNVLSELATLEQIVAKMFKISLQDAKGDECNEEI
ncbi:cation antiporter [Shewanella sediminis HAW-EB3]|uniref:Cation antiporter n=1 Tax=Shewanella sediminis (strain HAW-EB3) TaxID=425104 RepID=A8FT28_SHESH|nr:Na+/H+ antiporter subunit E [Shewanella sediminis]ABV36001.1 cation antiporter [Shewanella sediminis HAW-EB3]